MTETRMLTAHFSVAEFERSTRAAEYLKQTGDPIWKNKMPIYVQSNAIQLCKYVLEVVREHFGMPIYISSGYRMPRLNKSIGGVTCSQHITGQAADIYIKNTEMPLKAVFDWMVRNCDYDQIIWETRPGGRKWIHVSYVDTTHNRKKAYTCSDGKNYVRYKIKKKIVKS